jgi:hypothetical protein
MRRLLCRLGLHWRREYSAWAGDVPERYCLRLCGARWVRKWSRWVRL